MTFFKENKYDIVFSDDGCTMYQINFKEKKYEKRNQI